MGFLYWSYKLLKSGYFNAYVSRIVIRKIAGKVIETVFHYAVIDHNCSP